MARKQDLAKLVVSLEAESAKLTKELDKANKHLSKFDKRATSVTASVKNAFGKMGGALLAGGVVIGLKNLVGGTLDTADALAKTADYVGLTTDALQELNFAAQRSGVSTEQLSGNMTAFVKRVGEAKANTGPLVSFLKKYDEQLLENIKNAKSQEEALELVAEAIKNAQTPTEKAAIANAAFSRSGINMVNMLKDGKAGLDGLRDAAREAGVVLEEDLLRSAEQLNDEWDSMVEGLTTKVQRAVLQTAQVVGFLADELDYLYQGASADDIVRLERQAADIKRIMEGGLIEAGERLRFFGKDGIVEYYDDEELQAELTKIEAAIEAYYNKPQRDKPSFTPVQLDLPEGDDTPAKVDKVTTKLSEQELAAQKARAELEKFAEALTKTHNPAQEVQENLAMIELAMEKGLITAEVYADAVFAAMDALDQGTDGVDTAIEDANDKLTEASGEMDKMKEVADELGMTFTSAFEDAILNGAKLSDVLKGLEQDILRIIMRKLITEPLANMVTGMLPSFDGGGFTGLGARSGGLDGKGGYLAMLHPKETVIDHTRGQGMAGGVTVVQNITTPNADSFRKSDRQLARDARFAFGGY